MAPGLPLSSLLITFFSQLFMCLSPIIVGSISSRMQKTWADPLLGPLAIVAMLIGYAFSFVMATVISIYSLCFPASGKTLVDWIMRENVRDDPKRRPESDPKRGTESDPKRDPESLVATPSAARNRGSFKLTTRQAIMMPIMFSIALFSSFMAIKFFGEESFNKVFVNFTYLNTFISPVVAFSALLRLIARRSLSKFERRFPADSADAFKFNLCDVMGILLGVALAVWYLLEKHWVLSNMIGFCAVYFFIILLRLDSVRTGCILLAGLLIYDVFWVFGTSVMGTVATSVNFPNKFVLHMRVLESGASGNGTALDPDVPETYITYTVIVGLADSAFPGTFIALLLRYDLSKGTNSKLYFALSILAYTLGLVVVNVVITIVDVPQPALFYLVPFTVGLPLIVALFRGEFGEMWRFRTTYIKGDEHDTNEDQGSQVAMAVSPDPETEISK